MMPLQQCAYIWRHSCIHFCITCTTKNTNYATKISLGITYGSGSCLYIIQAAICRQPWPGDNDKITLMAMMTRTFSYITLKCDHPCYMKQLLKGPNDSAGSTCSFSSCRRLGDRRCSSHLKGPHPCSIPVIAARLSLVACSSYHITSLLIQALPITSMLACYHKTKCIHNEIYITLNCTKEITTSSLKRDMEDIIKAIREKWVSM